MPPGSDVEKSCVNFKALNSTQKTRCSFRYPRRDIAVHPRFDLKHPVTGHLYISVMNVDILYGRLRFAAHDLML